MDFNDIIPITNVSEEHPPQQLTIQERQLQVILQQQQFILKQQQQITLYQQQQRVLELEQQFQELVWKQYLIQQQPPQLSLQEQLKLQPRQQEVLYHQQQIMYKQRVELHILEQQQQWQLRQQQQLLIPQRNKQAGDITNLPISWYLDKCRSQLSQNLTASTIINGKSLMNIVNEHSALATIIENKFKELTGLQSTYDSDDLIGKLRTIIKIVGEKGSIQNEIADDKNEPYSPFVEPEVIIDYVKELATQPEMTDSSSSGHEDINNYAERNNISRSEISSWDGQQQYEKKDNSQRQTESDAEPDRTFKIKFPGPSR